MALPERGELVARREQRLDQLPRLAVVVGGAVGGAQRGDVAARVQAVVGRHAVADDVGPAIANLLRPGNGWITGQRIEVAGGVHL